MIKKLPNNKDCQYMKMGYSWVYLSLPLVYLLCAVTLANSANRVKREDEPEPCNVAPPHIDEISASFADMPLLFEHVMSLLQRNPSILERTDLMDLMDSGLGRKRREITPDEYRKLQNFFDQAYTENNRKKAEMKKNETN